MSRTVSGSLLMLAGAAAFVVAMLQRGTDASGIASLLGAVLVFGGGALVVAGRTRKTPAGAAETPPAKDDRSLRERLSAAFSCAQCGAKHPSHYCSKCTHYFCEDCLNVFAQRLARDRLGLKPGAPEPAGIIVNAYDSEGRTFCPTCYDAFRRSIGPVWGTDYVEIFLAEPTVCPNPLRRSK